MNKQSQFQFWLHDMDKGCPQHVLDSDEEFAAACWNAAIHHALLLIPAGDVADNIRELIEKPTQGTTYE